MYLQGFRVSCVSDCRFTRVPTEPRLVDAVPDEGMGRIARFFLLGGQDASDNKYNNNNDQYGNNFGLGNKDTSNLLNLNLNSREIQEVCRQLEKLDGDHGG